MLVQQGFELAGSLGVVTPRDVSSLRGFQLDPDALAKAMRVKLYDSVELGNDPRCAPSAPTHFMH